MLERDRIFPHTIARRARECPDRIFLQHVDGSEMAYGELHSRALHWAGGLAALGVAKGDTALVMLPNTAESVLSWLAISWAGGIEVPVNTAYRGKLLEYIINNSTARVLITCPEYIERIEAVAAGFTHLRTVIVVRGATPSSTTLPSVMDGATALDAATPIVSDGPAYYDIANIVYTSGTTGPSKGVMMPWAQSHEMSISCLPVDGFGEDDAWYSPFPLFHMSGKIALYASALQNCRFVMRESFSTRDFWPDVDRFGCTISLLIGTTNAFVWSLPEQPDDADHPLKYSLQSPLPADPDAYMKRFGIKIGSCFNMTEISAPIWTHWTLHGRSCGRLRPGQQLRIVDEHDEEVPPGTIGEIIVRTDQPWLMNAGYFNMPEKTVEAWRNGWFHTGDVGYVDEDGWYYYLDRKKDALRRRGENISSMELEALVNDHPDVQESAVIGVASDLGEDDVKVVITIRPDCDFTPESLITYLIPRIPRFMIPRYVEVLDALPKTPTEKVRKEVLRQAGVTPGTWDREKSRMVLPR